MASGVLGRFGTSCNVSFKIDENNLHLTLNSTKDKVDNEFNLLKDVLQSCYGDKAVYEQGDGYELVKLSFVDGGTVSKFVKDSSGIYISVEQLITKGDFSQYAKRIYPILPLISDNIDSDVSVILPVISWTASVFHQFKSYDWKVPDETYSQASFDVLSKVGSQLNLGIGTNAVQDTGWIQLDTVQDSSNLGGMTAYTPYVRVLLKDFNSSLSLVNTISLNFYDAFYIITWDYFFDFNGGYTFTIQFACESNSPNPPVKCIDISKDNPLSKYYPVSFEKKYSVNISEQIGLANSLLNYSRIKFNEQLSNTLPKYSVSVLDSSVDLNDLIGSPMFVVDRNNMKYIVAALVNAEYDQTNGVWNVELDAFIPYDLTNTYGFINDFREFSFRIKENITTNETSASTDYNFSNSCTITSSETGWEHFDTEEDVKILNDTGTASPFDYLSAIFLDSYNQPLTQVVPVFTQLPETVNFPSPVLIGLPLQYISQEEFTTSQYQANYLSLDKIDDVDSLGVVKPLVAATPHPSGNGYILPVVLPNLVAYPIKQKLGYTPTKIFINAHPDMVSDTQAFIASYVRDSDDGKYQIYIMETPINLNRPTEIVRF